MTFYDGHERQSKRRREVGRGKEGKQTGVNFSVILLGNRELVSIDNYTGFSFRRGTESK